MIGAAGDELGEDPAGPDRGQVVNSGTPCWLIVQADKDWRDFHKTFKEQEHEGKKPGGEDIFDSRANGKSCEDEGDSGERRPKISKRHPVRDDGREDANTDEVK